jgi:hypothetical protein
VLLPAGLGLQFFVEEVHLGLELVPQAEQLVVSQVHRVLGPHPRVPPPHSGTRITTQSLRDFYTHVHVKDAVRCSICSCNSNTCPKKSLLTNVIFIENMLEILQGIMFITKN